MTRGPFPHRLAWPNPALSRRRFLLGSAAAVVSSSLWGCFGDSDPMGVSSDGRLQARPRAPGSTPVRGESPLGLESGRDGLIYVPSAYEPATPAPLLVLLHGAGGSAADWRSAFPTAAGRGIVVLAPDSRGTTWDRIHGDFGRDLAFLDAAMSQVFSLCAIDPLRVALAGFSDGASYALSLGVGNGDLFSHLVAFSPGLVASGPTLVGKPRIFVSHGSQDRVISLQTSRDAIVPLLTDAGYDVRFEVFDGGHTVPATVFDQSLDWFLG